MQDVDNEGPFTNAWTVDPVRKHQDWTQGVRDFNPQQRNGQRSNEQRTNCL